MIQLCNSDADEARLSPWSKNTCRSAVELELCVEMETAWRLQMHYGSVYSGGSSNFSQTRSIK